MKTSCIYHSIDLDGWMSAAIVKHWFIENNKTDNSSLEQKDESIIVEDLSKFPVKVSTLDFIGYNYGQPIPDLSEYDKVIMCDISFPKEGMGKLLTNNPENVVWIDHHISSISDNKELMSINTLYGLRDTKFAACELTWKYFFPNQSMPEIVRLLGRYDCFGHKGTDEEQSVLEFQYGARQCIANYNDAYKYLNFEINSYKPNPNNYDREENPIKRIFNKGKSIYQYLCTEAKQSYKNGFPIYFEVISNEEESIEGAYKKHSYLINRYKFICINKERFNPINFGIDYHKDGYDGSACFYFDGSNYRFSLYNDNGEVDCSQIAKQYGGGGHSGAAGFIIDDLNKIIN